jgi:Raf kinase inhibitor-like YbhB/YbcL family protein
MKLTSTAFEADAVIPAKYTGVGDDVSPALSWSGAPEGTASFALICDDPDAPSRKAPRKEGPWVHWVIYNIPPDVTELMEAVPHGTDLTSPDGARQGLNDFGDNNIGYRGPMPPPGSGPHRYFFKLYALDTMLQLEVEGATKASLLAAMEGHILGEGKLMGTFERK